MALLDAGLKSFEKCAASTQCSQWGVYILEQEQNEILPSLKTKEGKTLISTSNNSHIKMRLLNHHV
jgi:hypothetical protein